MKNLLEQLEISVPMIQAPMAGVPTPAIAAAVSNAGGLGSIGVGAVNANDARVMIQATQALTNHPINVNVFCHRPAVANEKRERNWLEQLAPHFARFNAQSPHQLEEIYKSFTEDDEMMDLLIDLRPKVVSFHFGMPGRDKISRLKNAGIVLLATAKSFDEARQLANAGIDAIVAQGYEAGGHRGVFDPTLSDDCLGMAALVRLLTANLEIPVIAAGGIMDGAGIATSIKLGAQAAQLGTAFINCPESSADSF